MIMREQILVNMCRQQCPTCFRKRQAPTVARYRDETDIARICVEDSLVEQAPDTYTPPTLGTIKATCTIQRRLQCVTHSNELVIGEVAGHGNGATKREPPGLNIDRMWLVGDPA